LGILAASIVAVYFGIKASTPAGFSWAMFSAVGQLDFKPLFADWGFVTAVLVFFIIDFFGGVGKYIGLFATMGKGIEQIPEENMKRSLYVDGIGNIFGGLLGASSLAVFVSSAVGISAGGRTGLTAVVTACFMLASLLIMPVIGAIPVQATSGILVFVGLLLVPWKHLLPGESRLPQLDWLVAVGAALVAFVTYGIDKAMLLGFLVYSVLIIKRGEAKAHWIMLIVTALLLAAVIAQW
jgi:AGZA family xanthine/uracil permease-like MFS transporter